MSTYHSLSLKAMQLIEDLDYFVDIECDRCTDGYPPHPYCRKRISKLEKLNLYGDEIISSTNVHDMEGVINRAKEILKNRTTNQPLTAARSATTSENTMSSSYSDDIVFSDNDDDSLLDIWSPPPETKSSTSASTSTSTCRGKRPMASGKEEEEPDKRKKAKLKPTSSNEEALPLLSQQLHLLTRQYKKVLHSEREIYPVKHLLMCLGKACDYHAIVEKDMRLSQDKILQKTHEDEEKRIKAGLKAKEEELLTCIICTVRRKSDVLRPCGHTFCTQCSVRMYTTDKKCPVCRKIIVAHQKMFLTN